MRYSTTYASTVGVGVSCGVEAEVGEAKGSVEHASQPVQVLRVLTLRSRPYLSFQNRPQDGRE